MDQKEIKAALKTAKCSLDEKDFKNVLKLCKNILKTDRNNYLALVFYGAAAQETDQKDEAPKAFKKAAELSPENLLAWRGLAAFYEKNECQNDSKDLLKVYERLIVLENDLSKVSETLEKFERLALSLEDISIVKRIIDEYQNFDNQKRLLVEKSIVMLLKCNIELPEDFVSDYGNFLFDLIFERHPSGNCSSFLKKYFRFLCKQKNCKEILIKANTLLNSCPDDVTVLEWICKAYTETPEKILEEDLSHFSPKEVYSKLIKIAPTSYLGFFCKAHHELLSKDFINARDSFKDAIKVKPNLAILWLNLCKCLILLFQFSEAEESALMALKNFEKTEANQENINHCEIKLLKCYSEQEDEEKWLKAEQLGNKLYKSNPDNVEILEYLTKALIKLQRYSDVEKHLSTLEQFNEQSAMAQYLKCLIFKYKNQLHDFKMSLEKLVESMPTCFDAWLELAKIYYHENNSDSCLSSLLKSTKLNQWCYWNFLYLGHCYRTMVGDLEKSRRCYQKAFQLNPNCAEIGMSLSDVYRILGKEDLNIELLSTVTSLNPTLKWAWFKLGLHYLATNQCHDAVSSFQVAVRLDPNDINAWECLGDAYFAQGSHTSALKSYEKVLEFNPDAIYPMLQNANIKNLIGLYQESVEEFRMINSKTSNYVPALKGHAEACLSLMKQYLSEHRNGSARDTCQEAINSLIMCLEQQKDLFCIWKLLGDFCTLLSTLPEKYCHLKVAQWLSVDMVNQNEDYILLDKLQVLKLGARSFSQAIAINSNLWNPWYDLAFTYNCMVEVYKTEDGKKQMRRLAYSAVKKSILLNENSWESWNLCGIILASKEIQNYSLAQHCFIKAILKNDTSAVTWTNLGTLYLDLNDLQIANQSFTEAQKYDHDYVFCWVGQAIIALKTGHHDAMDLFRHSTQLGFCGEGCLGYSNLVCQTLLNTKDKNNKNYLYSIKNMNAITVSCDVLTWYTDRYTNNAWAFNMLGLLLERQMLYKRSAEAFARALEITQSEKVKQGGEDDRYERIDKILLNYGRVLSRISMYDEAVANLKQIKKANLTNQCELAAAYFRAKKYEEAYASYESTLEWLAYDVEVKSHILVAMASVVYLHQGQEDAKILLMQSCQLKPTSVQGLFACCALGILHEDLALSELALKELNHYKSDPKYLSHIAVFQAYMYLFKGQKPKAIRALCDIVHRHPDQPSLWLSLCLLLLHLHPYFEIKNAAKCAKVALTSGRSSIDVSKVMSLVSLSHLLSGEGLKSLNSSQKAVHMFPYVTESWVVLVASVLSRALLRQTTENVLWMKKMITVIRRKFESTKPMNQWLSNTDRKITLMADNLVS